MFIKNKTNRDDCNFSNSERNKPKKSDVFGYLIRRREVQHMVNDFTATFCTRTQAIFCHYRTAVVS